MESARFIFRGSLDFKVELNRLKRTENIMQRDSTYTSLLLHLYQGYQ